MDSLPSLSELQAALLYDPEAEEELLSVIIHLLVCAIDDPGIPTPHKHLTLLGQNLKQADITNTNVSEILKIYLRARGQVEVKNLHGVTPPETHSLKDRSKEIPYCHKRMEEFNQFLHKTRAYEMSTWVQEKPYLCLSPTQKAEILAFVCNELLFNKAVVHKIESTLEKSGNAKKVKVAVDHKLKRLKSIQMRKFKVPNKPDDTYDHSVSHMEDTTSEAASTAGDVDKEDTMSVMSESNNEAPTPKKVKGKRGRKPKNKPKEEQEESNQQENEEDKVSDVDMDELEEDEEEEEKLNADELQKKIEKTSKLFIKKRDEMVFINNCLRVNDLGQDRFRRRYWHFAHAGGVFVEGLESNEPWKLEHQGMPHVDKVIKEEEEDEDEDEEDEEPKPKKMKEEEDGKENVKQETTEDVLKKLGSDVLVTPKMENKKEDVLKNLISPKVTPNGDKLNLFNHSAQFNMALSPVVLNGAVTITPKTGFETGFSTSSPIINHSQSNDKPWFSLLPLAKASTVDRSNQFEKLRRESLNSGNQTAEALLQSVSPVNPQIALLELRLEQLKKSNVRKDRRPIPEG